MPKAFKKILFIHLLLLGLSSKAQQAVVKIDSAFFGPKKFNDVFNLQVKPGDDFKVLYDSYVINNWKNESELSTNPKLSDECASGITWFGKVLDIDKKIAGKKLIIQLAHQGASQVFIDGKFITSFGVPSANKQGEFAYQPRHDPFYYTFNSPGKHTILVRYSNHQYPIYKFFFHGMEYGFALKLGLYREGDNRYIGHNGIYTYGFLAIFGFLLALSLLHYLIYRFYKEQRSNLYYSLFALSFAFFILCEETSNLGTNPLFSAFSDYYAWRIFVITFFLLLRLVFSIVYQETPGWIKRSSNIAMGIIASILFLMPFIPMQIIYFVIVIGISGSCASISIIIGKAIKQKLEGIRIVGRGFLILIYFTGAYYILTTFVPLTFTADSFIGYTVFVLLAIGALSTPVSMSVYLARRFARTNIELKEKLMEVETLSARSLEQEREKQKIIAGQKEELEVQVKLRTAEVVAQKEELGHKNKEIIDSITYAKRLQSAILPPQKVINSYFKNNFLLYKPKDIVAGDFYWTHKKDDWVYIAAADSTGHGVPGAMVSIVCSNALDKAVQELSEVNTGTILDKTTELVLETFSKSGEEIKDGMDISLLAYNTKTKEINWSGANNPLWYFNASGAHEIKADKQPVGKSDHRTPFTRHQINTEPNTLFILMTDGYADQFGGPKGKKFMYKRLNAELNSVSQLNLEQQKEELLKKFTEWKGSLEQVDDVCVIGIKL